VQSLTLYYQPPPFDDALSQEYTERSALMFPHLRELSLVYWEHACCTSATVLPHLFSLSIRRAGKNIAHIIPQILQGCQDLRHLHVTFAKKQTEETKVAIENAFDISISSARNLERLEFDCYTPQAVIDKIGLLRRLQLLRIGVQIWNPFPTPTDRNAKNSLFLPSLRTIIIHGSSMNKLEALTHYLGGRLETMELTTQNAEEQELISWLRRLKNQHQNTLKSLCIATSAPSLSVSQDLTSSLSGFSLVELRLEGFLYGAEPGNLISLADSFAALEVLMITNNVWRATEFMTFRTFSKLLFHCPRLDSLGLNIDFISAERLEADLPVSNLRHLDVAQSVLAGLQVGWVVELFQKIFPMLHKLDWFGFTAGGHDDMMHNIEYHPWGVVRDTLGVCGSRRNEEVDEV
jgi:hypothetical protein